MQRSHLHYSKMQKGTQSYTHQGAKYSATVKSSPEAVQENSSRQGSEPRHILLYSCEVKTGNLQVKQHNNME